MTTSHEIDEARDVEQYDQLVTPGFSALADFAGFGAYEAVAVQETGRDISGLIDGIAEAIITHLMTRPESVPLMGGSGPVGEPACDQGVAVQDERRSVRR